MDMTFINSPGCDSTPPSSLQLFFTWKATLTMTGHIIVYNDLNFSLYGRDVTDSVLLKVRRSVFPGITVSSTLQRQHHRWNHINKGLLV